jgi:cyclophilin family peptidyl-prolyl cis-trans isomerase
VKLNRLFRLIALCAGVFTFALPALGQDAATPQALCDAALPAFNPETRDFAAPEQVLEPGVDYRAIFCTGAGAIYIDLFEDFAPVTVNSFVFLAQQGFYNNTTFHRVIADFMAQGGDPTASGAGGPGYQFQDEFVGFLNFDRPGWLAMANAGAGTNGSQFFITTVPTPHLDFRHTIFGEVLEGQENVTAIDLRDPSTATTPGEALFTVLIVTDPSTVQTTYTAPESATAEEYTDLINELTASVPEPLSVNGDLTGVFDSAETLARLPEAARAGAEAVFSANGHSLRVQHAVANAGCALDRVPYMAIGFTLDRFESPAAAAAALADGWYTAQYTDDGFTAETVEGAPFPVLSRETTACETSAREIVTFFQRGRAVETVTATIPAEHPIPPYRWLNELVALSTYDYIFGALIRTELR